MCRSMPRRMSTLDEPDMRRLTCSRGTATANPLGLRHFPGVCARARRLAERNRDLFAVGPSRLVTRSMAIAGGRGWGLSQPVDFQGPVIRAPSAVWETATDVGFAEGTELTLTLTHDSLTRGNLGRFRLSVTNDSRDEFADGLEQSGDVTANWVPLMPFEMTSAEGANMVLLAGRFDPGRRGANRRDTYTIKAVTSLQKITGIRLETIKDASLPGRAGREEAADGNAILSEITLAVAPATLSHELSPEISSPLAAQMQGQRTSLYVRMPFQLSAAELSSFDRLRLRLRYGDGFVAYLNGQEIARQGISGAAAFDSSADASRPGQRPWSTTSWMCPVAWGCCARASNLLAIHALNASPNQPSLLLDPELIADAEPDLQLTQHLNFRARTLNEGEWSALTAAEFCLSGDLNGDGAVDAQDVDRLCSAIRQADQQFDLNGDGLVDLIDLDVLVRTSWARRTATPTWTAVLIRATW